LISDLVFTQKDKVIRTGIGAAFIKPGAGSYVDLTADNGLDPLGLASAVKGDGAIHHAVIRESDRIMPAFLRALRDLADTASTVKQAIFTV
jgi:hypothetical protein